jgi:hypothetical protein
MADLDCREALLRRGRDRRIGADAFLVSRRDGFQQSGLDLGRTTMLASDVAETLFARTAFTPSPPLL